MTYDEWATTPPDAALACATRGCGGDAAPGESFCRSCLEDAQPRPDDVVSIEVDLPRWVYDALADAAERSDGEVDAVEDVAASLLTRWAGEQ